jgi:hypothetical protein
VIDGTSFTALEVGFAWPSSDAAVADAKQRIDYLKRYTSLGQTLRTQWAVAS